MVDGNNPKISLITSCFYPNTIASPGILLTELAVGLKERDCDVKVITGYPSFWDTKIKVEKRENYQGIDIHRVYSTQFYNKSKFGRLLNVFSFLISVFWKLLISKEDRIFISVTVPPFLPYICFALNKIMHKKYILIVYDIYPDVAVASRVGYSQFSIIAKIWDKTSSWVYEDSVKLVVLDQYMAKVIRKKIKKDHFAKIEIIQNWEDENFIIPLNKEDNWFSKKYKLVDRFVVLYSGNLGASHDLESLFEAAKYLKEEEKIKFLFIGEGIKKDKLMKDTRAFALKNVEFLPFQPKKILPYTLTSSDLIVITQKKGTEGLCVSCKLYSALAAGRPILAIIGKNSEIARVVEKYNCGIVINNNDIAGIVNAILRIQRNKKLQMKMGENARKCLINNFTKTHAIEKYFEMVKNLWQ